MHDKLRKFELILDFYASWNFLFACPKFEHNWPLLCDGLLVCLHHAIHSVKYFYSYFIKKYIYTWRDRFVLRFHKTYDKYKEKFSFIVLLHPCNFEDQSSFLLCLHVWKNICIAFLALCFCFSHFMLHLCNLQFTPLMFTICNWIIKHEQSANMQNVFCKKDINVKVTI